MIDKETAIAVNRFGLGPRPGEVERVSPDPRGWLRAQLKNPRVGKAPSVSSDLLSDRFDALRQLLGPQSNASETEKKQARQQLRRRHREIFAEFVGLRCSQSRASATPFVERLVRFWGNHFAVSADKAQLGPAAATLEVEAIRPRVTGRFADLVKAVVSHPVMLVYLDNIQSIGPNSAGARFGRRRKNRDLDINENLAREILELHTLGVSGGYRQSDVEALARALTGWSMGGQLGPLKGGPHGQFYFRSILHEPGAQTVLGKKYSQSGVRQAEAILEDLASHPATARFLALKLARHFVADAPPKSVVDRLANAYRNSGGDLTAVYISLIHSPEVWESPREKLKSPEDFVHSSIRVLGWQPENLGILVAAQKTMGQMPFTPGSPAGWPDTAAHWQGPNALLKRIEWADQLGKNLGAARDARDLLDQTAGSTASAETRIAIARAESPAQALTLFLMSPEFQYR